MGLIFFRLGSFELRASLLGSTGIIGAYGFRVEEVVGSRFE